VTVALIFALERVLKNKGNTVVMPIKKKLAQYHLVPVALRKFGAKKADNRE
jgi:hypothetical protein